MGCRGLPTIHPGSSIPELINFVRHSFRECEFDEVQNTLMEREKGLKIEILNISRDCDSLKKDIDLLRSSQSSMNLEKFRMGKEIEELKSEKLGLEAKLNNSHRKCEEMDDRIVRMEKEIEDMRREKLSLEEKLDSARSKCEDRNASLVRMEKEIDDLRREKLSFVEKLDSSRNKCVERDGRLVRMGKEIDDLKREKLSLVVKLDSSCSKCEEKDERLVRMEKEIEELWHEKVILERKLDSTHSKCEERNDKLVRMRKEIDGLRYEKLSLAEKLDRSCIECQEKVEQLVRMEKEIEELLHAKLDANKTINELKGKEIEATRTIDELRVRLKTALAKMLHVNVEDLSKLINGTEILAAATEAEEKSVNLSHSGEGDRDSLGNDYANADAEDGIAMLPEVGAASGNSSGSGGVGSSKEGGRACSTKAGGAIVICTLESAHSSAVAESNEIVQDSEGKAAEVKGKSSSAAENENAKAICDSDDETYGQATKRNRRDDSPINWSAKRKTSRLEETLTDSDDESCSDAYMDSLIAAFLSKGRNTK